ncbi:EamA family transporter [Bordetella genomosp. 5]|uniref:aromatic amino acid DMT transporter YddG n=1 Tax=Bordetella genomosp. 5 TaxID=1395608 RepID=UPI000B9E54E9|nr:aromatic amino acid DMT transporter YddG [Bordetella genomosp. 5]OZI42643.1 EamA family transporter [Bordetella genomosp. 5]
MTPHTHTPSPTDADTRRATLIGLCAVLCWSAMVGLMRSVTEALGPAGGGALLFTTSALLVTLARGWPRLRDFHPVYLLGGGALFVAYEACLALSIGYAHTRAQSLELGMINYLWPCLTLVLAVLCGQARASAWIWPGALLSLAGIVWVLNGDGSASITRFVANLQDNPVAYTLAFIAAGLWACYSVLTRRYGRGQNGVPVFLWGAALVLWIKYGLSAEPALHMTPGALAEVALLSLLTATGYSCWNHGVQHGNIAVMAAGSYFTPVLSVLLASLWLRTQPTLGFWQGVIMVTVGSLICWRATRR